MTKLVIHLVFTTKYRGKLFDGTMRQQFLEAFGSPCEKLDSLTTLRVKRVNNCREAHRNTL
ncbi:transposase (plasmid) [Pseudoalteromonas xiamenensis]|uniref:Transposase n=1 Tax=Pseudoalteromonas xiamenensis TaxID=882626 RepID=A0A975DJQ1_9GAMM|nr:transposase [Pseudoalteromonas xiamenensis]